MSLRNTERDISGHFRNEFKVNETHELRSEVLTTVKRSTVVFWFVGGYNLQDHTALHTRRPQSTISTHGPDDGGSKHL
jgi:hypothetical protein